MWQQPFRKELMNAPKNQEIAHASDEEVVIFPKLQQSPISEPIQNISPGLPKELPLKQKPQGKQTSGMEPSSSSFSHGPKSWKPTQKYSSPNTSSKFYLPSTMLHSKLLHNAPHNVALFWISYVFI